MTAPAFTKFDPRAFLQNEQPRVAAAKPAKVAKAPELEPSATFATFATFAGGQAEKQNFEPAPDIWTDAHEERAAIVEHDGGVPREWAEGFARLDCSHPPADVPSRRWHQFIDDCGLFLDNGWAAKAAALGWGPRELFGADGRAPFGRVDRAGLLWLLNGNRLVALTANTAIIETATGARQTYYRTPVESEQIALAWELSG